METLVVKEYSWTKPAYQLYVWTRILIWTKVTWVGVCKRGSSDSLSSAYTFHHDSTIIAEAITMIQMQNNSINYRVLPSLSKKELKLVGNFQVTTCICLPLYIICRDCRTKKRESEGREVMLCMLLKLLMKYKLFYNERYAWTEKNGSWNPSEERETRLQQTSTNQHERLTVETPRREKQGYSGWKIDCTLPPPPVFKTMSSI